MSIEWLHNWHTKNDHDMLEQYDEESKLTLKVMREPTDFHRRYFATEVGSVLE